MPPIATLSKPPRRISRDTARGLRAAAIDQASGARVAVSAAAAHPGMLLTPPFCFEASNK